MLKQQLMPVFGTCQLDGRTDDLMHRVLVELTNDPVPSIALGTECRHLFSVIREMPSASKRLIGTAYRIVGLPHGVVHVLPIVVCCVSV